MNAPSPPDNSTTGRHLPALDGIRGTAILLVLADHLLWSNPVLQAPQWVLMLVSLHSAGWVGVDLFFVLSGFLITGILYDTLPSRHFFRNFYARRALRIFPLYYGFLLFLYLLSRLGGAHWRALNTLQFLTYTENLFGAGPPTNAWWINVNHFWSLAVEEQFYLVWPMLVFLLRKRRRIALVAGAGAILSFGVRLYLWHTPQAAGNPYILYSWTPARLDGLLTGACLAIVFRSRYREWLLRVCRPALLVGLLVLVLFYLHYPGFYFNVYLAVAVWVPCVLALTFAAMIAAALRPDSRSQRFFSARSLRFHGRYSYGLYIFHPTIAMLISTPLRAFFRTALHSKGAAVLLEAAVTYALSVVAAWLSFRYFEAPCLRLKARFHDDSAKPKLAAMAASETDPHNLPSGQQA